MISSNGRNWIRAFALIQLSTCGLFACGSSSETPAPTTDANGCTTSYPSCTSATASVIPTSSTNILPIYLADTHTTGKYGYVNEPLVSVTVCSPNHTSSSQCQVISNILLDTGSSGLRIFGSAIASNVQLSQQSISTTDGRKNLAECTPFGSGADWGPIQTADVILGNQTASNISVQVIDYHYGFIPDDCAIRCADVDPCDAGYNGILGVAPFIADCGSNCASTDDNVNSRAYYGCDNTGCYNASEGNCGSDGICAFDVTLSAQVSNPIAAFASGFNNGLSIQLPSVGPAGASQVTGSMTLGISSSSVGGVYTIDPNGQTDGNYLDFNTLYNGTTYGFQSGSGLSAFLDSGSNAIYFPGNFTQCGQSFCPATPQNLSAIMQGYHGSPSTTISFSVASAQDLQATGNSAFSNFAGYTDKNFDWGLPFFFNRTVYFGIEGTHATLNSSVATGPYWAF